jgi:large subunit ribosomal protein L10
MQTKQRTHHVSDEKKKIVKDITKLINEYPIIGAVNMQSLPARQLQQMRSTLRGKVVLLMTKKRLMKIALEDSKGKKAGVEKLLPYLKGMPALLFTKDNPFALAKVLKANKSTAPIKAGQIAPQDIIVKEGPTTFSPGPIIGELGAAGIKAGIEAGKVKIMKESVVVEEGKPVSKKIAEILMRLGVEPVEIGLDLTAVYENGGIIAKEILFVDEKEYIDKMVLASSWAFTLSIEVGYITKDNINMLLAKSNQNAHAVAIKASILTEETKAELLAQAEREAESVQSKVNV